MARRNLFPMNFRGSKQSKYLWMEENAPAFCEALREEGTIEEFLKDWEQRFRSYLLELEDEQNPNGVCAMLGLTEELKAKDCGAWMDKAEQVHPMAVEIAYREFLPALEPIHLQRFLSPEAMNRALESTDLTILT